MSASGRRSTVSVACRRNPRNAVTLDIGTLPASALRQLHSDKGATFTWPLREWWFLMRVFRRGDSSRRVGLVSLDDILAIYRASGWWRDSH